MSLIRERIALKQLLRELLVERGAGSNFAAAEAAAKAELNRAQQEFDEWQAETDKKAAFLAWALAGGLKPDSAAAQKEKKAKPQQYDYDPKIVQKAEKTLQSALAKAKARAADFDPLAADVQSKPKLRGMSSKGDEAKAPDPKKPSYGNLKQIAEQEPLAMQPWSKWAKVIKAVPIGGFGESKEGAGHPGEERLAKIFGAERQGDNVSFDLADKDGLKWEVKGLERESSHIRPGTLGSAVFVKSAAQLLYVCRQMRNFTREVKAIGVDKVCTTDNQKTALKRIDMVLEEEFEDVQRREISRTRLFKIQVALKAAAYLKDAWEAELGPKGRERISMGGKDVDVNRRRYIDVARRLAKQPGAEGLMETVDARERCLFRLQDREAFSDPGKWMDKWEGSIDVRKIFADVDGVIIVRPEGFAVVPRKYFAQAFAFERSSQDTPRFSFDPTLGGEAAQESPKRGEEKAA